MVKFIVPSLTSEIKRKAIEIGFDKVGIARADRLDAESVHLNEWLERGLHGKMAWMAREPEKRADPGLLMPEALSVIVVALNYFTEHEHPAEPGRGKISRYAWGDDYHDVLRDRLKILLEWLETRVPGLKSKICIDTAPMMDKAWAARAGLGWIGKHSNLITKEIGSWVFLGSLLVDIELDYDTDTVDDHCGTCTACLDACPTDAIIEPYVVDSRKCISYATIELRDETLPADISQHLNGWLYGCDICQDVCPWNRFEIATGESRFEPRLGETSLDIDSMIEMQPDEYVTRFRRSAMKRTKLHGLARNARAIKNGQ